MAAREARLLTYIYKYTRTLIYIVIATIIIIIIIVIIATTSIITILLYDLSIGRALQREPP